MKAHKLIGMNMKTSILLITFILVLCTDLFSQLIVDKGIYKANFSNSYHESNYVSYILSVEVFLEIKR